MAFDAHKNFAYSTVATAPSPATSGTSLVVAAGDGAKFPTPPFNATVWPVNSQPLTTNAEVVRVTAISTDTLTITRSQESSSARTIVVGDQISASITAKTLTDVEAMNSTSLIRNETPGGSVNGSNTAFTTASTFQTGSLRVHLNGQRLSPGGADYTEGTQGFTMAYAPATGDILLVDYETSNSAYVIGSNSSIVQETPTGSVNGSNTLFTVLQGKYVANSLQVWLNGVLQTKTTDYTETSPGSGTFVFTTAPLTGQTIKVSYQFSTGSSGNADTVDGIHASATATANNLYPLNASAKFSVDVLGTGATRGYVAALETTTSTSYVDLTTVGPSVTVTIGANGLALVMFGAEMFNSIVNDYVDMSIVVSGTNTIAIGTNPYRLFAQATGTNTPDNKYQYCTLLTGLTPGSTTFKCQYKVITGGTGTFQYRELSVIPL